MNAIKESPIASKEMNLFCPACQKLSSPSDQFEVSSFQDCSFAGFTYQKCGECSTIFLANALTDDELTDLHVKYWGAGENFTFKFLPDKTPISWKAEWFEHYTSILGPLRNDPNEVGEGSSELVLKRRLLDIGSGNGSFCAAATELGFDAYGLEPNQSSFDLAVASFPEVTFINGSTADFFEEKLSNLPATFDIITLHDVLEHIVSPSILISRLGKKLAPGGRIFIAVPSSNHLQFDHLRQYSWALMAPFHRTLFSRDGIETMLRGINFDVLKWHQSGHVYGWTRGISWKLGIEKEYREMRKNPNFVKLDYAIDTMLEEISYAMNRDPRIFCEIGLSE
jgi:2-polyprenyl-3-methyl-5-hydroxy-6-metoxy-1,4-benzoquinol methylase